jgi:alpha,alpha-trehalase
MAAKGITPERFDAVLFDLDGVLTSTAKVHAACWKRMFDEFLGRRADETGEPFRPFDIEADYRPYLDGKPRYVGVESFLASRSIELPYGDPGDPPDAVTVCGLGNRKQQLVQEALREGGAEAYEGSVTLVRLILDSGIRTAVVSSSANCEDVLRAAGIRELFEVVVDGKVSARLGHTGKPAPDAFLEASSRLGVDPERAVVVEDAISGVQAGRDGGFGLVIGVDRGGDATSLRENGADVVVSDLGELVEER